MFRLGQHELILLTALKKAATDGELCIPCKSISTARAVRAQAYALMRKLRKHVDKHPEEISLDQSLQAAEGVSLSVSETGVMIRRRELMEGILAVSAALEAGGIRQVTSPDEDAIAESLRKLQDMGLVKGDEK